MELVGKVSWFGGPNDPSAGSQTASGASVTEPGIAVYNHATLGGYWRVTFPNGRSVVLKQTDIGPAPWTGRKVDVTSSALSRAGYSEGNFPTDSTVKADYLGKSPTAAQSVGASPPQQSGSQKTSTTIPGQDNSDARKSLMIQYLLGEANKPILKVQNAQNPNTVQNVLSESSGLLNTLKQISQLKDVPSQTVTSNSPGGGQMAAPGSAKGVLPGGFKVERVDQGQDLQANRPGGPVVSPGNGVVVAVPSNPGGFGPSYPVIHFTSGPWAGKSVYFGHTLANVRPGQRISAGQVISHTGTSGVGNASSPGWAEIGFWGPGGPTGNGGAIAPFFK